ncbi:MAG: extracellular solute-binding protein [Proteobacteria bacterium]|nr:extracellular solute-binding protein [Pseudomonadota bacterium]
MARVTRRVTRRNFLALSAGGAAAATTGGLAGILATGRAPAFAQGTELHWLRWSDFVPASDEMLRKTLVPEAEKALGAKIRLETINANDIQARITSSVQSATGPDIIMTFNNWPHLYAESVVDLSDLATEIGGKQAGYYELCKANTQSGRLGLPWVIIGALMTYRKSWFDEVGVTKFPETWDDYRAAGKKLKAKGHPVGQTLAHTFGDGITFVYPLMWSFGGREVDAAGKVILNSKGTVESVKFMTAFWKEAHDEAGIAWDDTGNNRAFLAGTISSTLNGASIYIESLRKPDNYQTEKGARMHTDILHAPMPRGPAGQFALHPFQAHMLMRYSKNQAPAKQLLRWMHEPANYERWFVSQKGFAAGPTTVWEQNKMWGEDPVMSPFRTAGQLGRAPGLEGLPNRKAAEVLTKYIITDMYAKAAQGMPAEDSVKWAHDELVKIYV